jgi:tRNA(adenine34) deaminase
MSDRPPQTLANDRTIWMQEALALARQAADLGEVPVGALVIHQERVVGRGFNRRETDKDALAHAEVRAIAEACKNLDSWRLSDCDLYVTLEPCVMCAGAIQQARMRHVYFGALDPKAGACGSLYRINEDSRLNHRFGVTGEILADESRNLLQSFFRAKRSSIP